ncbi:MULTISPECIES: hypothetical protein [Corallococcus]|uniref:hypothetical protein n=1 Tax=Corallococcus TaxID=83461 RepID=UPI00117FDE00|nr:MULTISPECIES: hypothetical protein [Corallococcus]NBD09908.1 hypothetical protein [Corallococcus silvisoli]TSC23878.1 hypothetical protein FOF48_27070 [Corallococcus sp. Z5C101001]
MIPPPSLRYLPHGLFASLLLGMVLMPLLFPPSLARAGSEGPDTFIDEGPPGATPSREATFVFTATTLKPVFWCSLDSSLFIPCESPWRLKDLSPGEHTLDVYAVDVNTARRDPTPSGWVWRVTERRQDTPRTPASAPP